MTEYNKPIFIQENLDNVGYTSGEVPPQIIDNPPLPLLQPQPLYPQTQPIYQP